jgi:hypothetical protein
MSRTSRKRQAASSLAASLSALVNEGGNNLPSDDEKVVAGPPSAGGIGTQNDAAGNDTANVPTVAAWRRTTRTLPFDGLLSFGTAKGAFVGPRPVVRN